MKREDVEKLLGGYATGSLTPDEREALFEAALQDQSLFDQLMREEALRVALDDPSARAHLLAALDEAPQPWHKRVLAWLNRPAGIAATASLAAAFVTVGVYLNYRWSQPQPTLVTQVSRQEMEQRMALRDEAKPFTPPPAAAPPASRVPPPPASRTAPVLREPKEVANLSGAIQATPSDALRGGGRSVPGGVAGGVVGGVPAFEQLRQADATTGQSKFRADEPAPAAALEKQKKEERTASAAPAAPAPPPPAAETVEPAAVAPALRSIRPMAAKAVGAPLNLRYTLFRRPAGGEFVETQPALPLEKGDEVRVVVEPTETGFLNVYERDPAAGWRLLLGERVEAGQRYQVPRSGAFAYERPGPKDLYLVFSRRPLAEGTRFDPRQSVRDLRAGSADQKSADATPRRERGNTVLNQVGAIDSQQVVIPLTLNYR